MLNDGTGAVYGVKTADPPENTVGSGEFPGNPSRSGYTFGGWNTAVEGTGSGFTALTVVSGDMTVYAQWTATPPGSFTVTFMTDDGTEAPLGVKNAVGGTVIPPEDFPTPPSGTGYNFGGWYTERNGGGSEFTASTTVSGNITVYARWDSYSYTVTFDNGGGDTEANPATKTVASPDTTVDALPIAPSRTDYLFMGWYTEQDGGGSEFTATTTVNGSITVYATWVYSYTVTFDNGGGDTAANPATKTVTGPDTTIGTLPIAPSKTDHLFMGWYTEQNGGGNEFTASTMVSGSITVYAAWVYSYTVTFDNGGGDTEANPATKTVTEPDTTINALPSSPSRTGYNFGGWYTEPNGGGSGFTATTTVNGSITVYAAWDTYSYTVTFDNDGGDTEANPPTKTVASPDTTIGALPIAPSRTDHLFMGWYTEQNGGGSEFTALTTVNGSITVYAKWVYSYTVTFDNGGGDTEANPATKTVTGPDTTLGTLPVPPSRTGYNFGGWYTEQNGGGSGFTATTMVSGSITVYARWDTYSYTVTFDNDGGDTAANPPTKTVATPDTTTGILPDPPSKAGYTFGGWYTGTDGTGSEFTDSTAVTDDITVYAWWTTGGIITLNPDAGDGAFSQGDFTISKPGGSQTISITGSDYTNPRWLVDGTLKGTDTSITVRAADYNLGVHNLSLLISRNGVTWSKDLAFTVTN
jgi:uncharacterized repeat protein (TIGR02543 family)